MKKYYYNNNGTVYTNDVRVSNRKTVTGCYSAYFTNTEKENKNCTGYHSPWFCLKDGKFPLYYLNSNNTEPTFKGFRRICDCDRG